MEYDLKQISKSTIDRYSERYKKLGRDVKTLGWGSDEQQRYRFNQVFRVLNLDGKHVLDIGCGFGDFYTLCSELDYKLCHYTGWDINPDLINEAKNQNKECSFDVVNIAESKILSPVADVGVMLGVLNLNFKDKFNNLEFSKMMIANAFSTVSETLVVDFLSAKRIKEYPPEDFVYYHDPSEMLSFALSLTPNVRLFHDYAPIPQKEFMLVLEHV